MSIGWIRHQDIVDALERQASPEEEAMGRRWASDGRITSVREEVGSGWVEVRGTARDPGSGSWKVWLRVDPTRVEGRCTCDTPGWPCRHLLAVTRRWAARHRVAGAGPQGLPWRTVLRRLTEGPVVSAPAGQEALVHWVDRREDGGLTLSWRLHRMRDGHPGPGRRTGWRQLLETPPACADGADRRLLRWVGALVAQGAETTGAGVRIPPDGVDPVLRCLAQTRFVYERAGRTPLRIEEVPVRVRLEALPGAAGVRLAAVCVGMDGRPWEPEGSIRVIGGQAPWLWAPEGVLRPVTGARDAEALELLLEGVVEVPEADVASFLGVSVPEMGEAGLQVDLAALRNRHLVVEPDPRPTLYLSEEGSDLVMRLRFRYGEVEVAAENPEPTLRVPLEGKQAFLQRDMEAEFRAARRLQHLGVEPAEPGLYVLRGEEALDFLHDHLPVLAREWEVLGREGLARYRVARRPVSLRVHVRAGIDWLDLGLEARTGGDEVPVHRVLEALRRGARYVKLDDGSQARLAKAWEARLLTPLQDLGLRKGRARVPAYLAPVVEELAARAPEVTWEDPRAWERVRKGLWEDPPDPAPPPEGLRAELRPYQLTGYRWLRRLGRLGCGGVLADDMGLGKTVQALAVLLAEREEGETGPNLVVAPTSVVPNWEAETRRFAPDLRIIRYHGAGRQERLDELAGHDLVITSYAVLRRDVEALEAVGWNWVVLDEAQAIKNASTQTAKAARRLSSRKRMALTGTPLENHLGELWSLFQFLTPGLLGSERSFVRSFVRPLVAGDPEAREALRRRIGPFVLRRIKAQVAPELPEKVESVLWCEMGPEQEALYRSILEASRAKVLRDLETRGLDRARFSVLEALLRLRQTCCLPQVLPGGLGDGVPSAKFDRFCEFVEEVLDEGHRVLVFSQFARVLGHLRRWFAGAGIEHLYLDGRTRNRGEKVRRFQEDESVRAFLVSLKAGGAGLNLTGADYVILYDPWWNPAVEVQATDRAHRIGQTRKVFAYRMITRGTVEEKILELQARKRELTEGLVPASAEESLTEEDLRRLFDL